MADQQVDPFASIVENCRCSSSQEELLSRSKFVRQDSGEDFSGPVEVPGEKDGSGERSEGEFEAVCADCEKLGFRGEGRESSGIEVGEVSRKRLRGSGLAGGRVGGRHLVHCSERTVIDRGEGEGSGGGSKRRVIVVANDVEVHIVSPLRCVAPPGGVEVRCGESLGSEGGSYDQCEVGRRDYEAKRKLDFEGDGEKMGGEDEVESDRRKDGDDVDVVERRGKRELPRSLLGQVWGVNDGGVGRPRNRVSGSGTKEHGFDEERVEEKGDGKFKGCETMRNLFDIVRILGIEKNYNDDDNDGGGEIDIVETAKRRGMMFPRSRFLPPLTQEEELSEP